MPRTRPCADLVLVAAICVVAGCTQEPTASFVTAVPWGLTGRTLVLDTHTHTRFSDGALLPTELAAIASANGCQALAITDHGDLTVRAATPEYFAEIRETRARFPGLILFGGLEWNVPPYRGREHATLLVEPGLEQLVLPAFKQQFEQKDAQADAALRWLAAQSKQSGDVILIYNHPSRQDQDGQENLKDYVGWSKVNALFVGFEGGPGHQKARSPGSYQGKFRTDARWDPVVAEIGGVWDRLLDQGHQVWGALAVSDYHNDQADFAPCEFSRTTLRVPHPDHRGVLLGLRAGSFWAGHGRVLDDLVFLAVSEGLPVPATPGEIIRLSRSARPVFRSKLTRGPAAKGRPLLVEVIGNGISGAPARVAARELMPDEDVFDWQPDRLVPGGDGKTAYFRVRVLASEPTHGLLVAYGNPIRIDLAR